MSFELGKGIQTWEDLKTAIAVLSWLQAQQSYVEIQIFLQNQILKAVRDMQASVELDWENLAKEIIASTSKGPVCPPEVPPQEDSQAPPDQSKTPPKE